MHHAARSKTQYGAGALAAGVCALGLSVAGVGAPTAWAAPSDTSSTSSDGTPSRVRSTSTEGPAPSGRAALGRRAIATPAPETAIGPAAAASEIRRRPAPAATAVPIRVIPTADAGRQAPAPLASATAADVAPSPMSTGAVPALLAPAVVATPAVPTRRPALTWSTPAPAAAVSSPASVAKSTSPAPAATSSSAAPIAPIPYPAAASGTLNAIATGNSTPVGDSTGLPIGSIGDIISGLVQLTRRWFFNTTPTAAAEQALVRPNGQTWGFLTAKDAEGEQIDYAITKNAQFGSVSITPSGVYSYTPGAGFTGTDSFTVTLTNPGFHINLLNLFDSQRRDLTVNVVTTDAKSVVDNFNGAAGSAPDPSLWGYHLGPLRDDGLQTYTKSPDNVRLDGQGNLIIQALNTADGYTSTRLVTQDKLAMQYGSIQARIKMPSGQGIWPAFWTLGTSYYPDQWSAWPACGEIDIMELVNTGSTYNVALHGPQGSTDYYGGTLGSGEFVGTRGQISEVAPISDLTDGFHDYWTIWRQDHIVVGVDGTTLAEFTPASLPSGAQWVFNQPMYAILQIAVGGDWAGPPDASTPWPATMLVDSFRYTPLG